MIVPVRSHNCHLFWLHFFGPLSQPPTQPSNHDGLFQICTHSAWQTTTASDRRSVSRRTRRGLLTRSEKSRPNIKASHEWGRRGGRGLRGESYPLWQGLPFVRCCHRSYLNPQNKVYPLDWIPGWGKGTCRRGRLRVEYCISQATPMHSCYRKYATFGVGWMAQTSLWQICFPPALPLILQN